jgi:hypothetical protein
MRQTIAQLHLDDLNFSNPEIDFSEVDGASYCMPTPHALLLLLLAAVASAATALRAPALSACVSTLMRAQTI